MSIVLRQLSSMQWFLSSPSESTKTESPCLRKKSFPIGLYNVCQIAKKTLPSTNTCISLLKAQKSQYAKSHKKPPLSETLCSLMKPILWLLSGRGLLYCHRVRFLLFAKSGKVWSKNTSSSISSRYSLSLIISLLRMTSLLLRFTSQDVLIASSFHVSRWLHSPASSFQYSRWLSSHDDSTFHDDFISPP